MKKDPKAQAAVQTLKDLGCSPDDVARTMKRLDELEADVSDLKSKVGDPEYIKKGFAALGGRAKSEAKARAARENGKKGWPLPVKGDDDE